MNKKICVFPIAPFLHGNHEGKNYNKNFSSIDTCLETYLSYIMKHQLQCHFQAGELRKEAKNGRRFVSSVPVLLICLTHSHHFLQPGYWTPTAVASSFG